MKIQQILISIILVIILIIWYYFKKNNNTLEHFQTSDNKFVLNIKCISSENSQVNSGAPGVTSHASVESNNCVIKEVTRSDFIKYSDPNFDDKKFKAYVMNNHSIKITPPNIYDIKNIGLYFNIKKDWVGNIMKLSFKSLFENALLKSKLKDYLMTKNVSIEDALKDIGEIMTKNIYVLNFNINKSGNLNISGNPDKLKFETWDLINDLKSPINVSTTGEVIIGGDDFFRFYGMEDIIESCADTLTYNFGPPKATKFLDGKEKRIEFTTNGSVKLDEKLLTDEQACSNLPGMCSEGAILNENLLENYICRTINTFKNLKTFNTEIPIKPTTDEFYKFWLNIKLLNPDNKTDPFIEINLNNDIKIHIKKEHIFTDVNKHTDLFNHLEEWTIKSFKGTVAEINGWNNLFTENICDYYSCEKNNRDKVCKFDIAKEYAVNNSNTYENKKDCITKCMTNNDCTVIDCQKRCLECRDENGQPFGKVNRDTYCPWIKNLIAPPQAPESPKIRGFSDEKKINKKNIPIIVLEWRKPNSLSSKIDNYIIEIEDLSIGSNGIKIINVPQLDKDNFQKEIMNLKPKTTYKINIVALGKSNIKTNDNEEILNLISKKSNVLTITTTGENNNILNHTYDYFDNDNKNLVSYVCDYKGTNSDHILNNINNDEIDIYKSLTNL